MKRPELVGLTIAAVAMVVCAVGLAVSLTAAPWVAWAFGLLLSGLAVVALGRRALDERTVRSDVARFAPEPPHRSQGPQL